MDAYRRRESLGDRLASFCKSRHIEALYVFGSRSGEILAAMGQDGSVSVQPSDVDIAVKLPADRTLSVREKAELAVELENLLGADRVDLVLLSEADPFLSVNAIRGERLYCRDEYLADEYELYVLRRAGDLARHERLRIAQILNSAGRR